MPVTYRDNIPNEESGGNSAVYSQRMLQVAYADYEKVLQQMSPQGRNAVLKQHVEAEKGETDYDRRRKSECERHEDYIDCAYLEIMVCFSLPWGSVPAELTARQGLLTDFVRLWESGIP